MPRIREPTGCTQTIFFRLPGPAPFAGLIPNQPLVDGGRHSGPRLTHDQRELGKANFREIPGDLTPPWLHEEHGGRWWGGRGLPLPPLILGYLQFDGKPVKAAIIAPATKGPCSMANTTLSSLSLLLSCDIRPTNQKRSLEKDPKSTSSGRA